MNLETWAGWVTQIAAITGGCVELSAGPSNSMTIAVIWKQDGRKMGYVQTLSMREIREVNKGLRPCVLGQIANAVRKMTPNDCSQARAVGTSPGVDCSATPGGSDAN